MSRLARLLVWILLVAVAAQATRAAWDDRSLGAPLLEVFGPRVLGQQSALWGLAQHPRSGAIYVGTTEGVIVFDGQAWTRHPLAPHSYVRSFAFQPDTDRVWVGAPSLGYFEASPGREIRFVSLRDKQPVPPDELRAIWACHAAESYVDFVANNHVLRWDGEKFLSWHYPDRLRLFPLLFEGALWFHHPSTGLYRLDARGPVKMFAPHELPSAPLFWLGRRNGELVGASNAGLQVLGASHRSLSSPALDRFAADGHLVGVAELPAGFQAWATLDSGLAIVSPNGEIVRRIGSESGLAASIFAELVDRDGFLWILTESSLVRLAATGATATVKLPDVSGAFTSLHGAEDETIWACADNRVFRVRPREAASEPVRVEALPVGLGGYRSAFPTPFGLLLGRFGAVDLYRDGQFTPGIGDFPSHLAEVVQKTNASAERFLVLRDDGFAELEHTSEGTWRTSGHSVSTTAASGIVEDTAGNVWMSNHTAPLLVASRENGRLAAPRPAFGQSPAFASETLVFRRRDDMLLTARRRVFLLRPDQPPRELPLQLPENPIGGAVSEDGERLYLRFQRANAPIGYNFGVGLVEISADARTARWRDLFIPGLSAIGQLTAIEVTRERGADTLWIGGGDGLLQASTLR